MLKPFFRLFLMFLILISLPKVSYADEVKIQLFADQIMADHENNYIYASGNVYVTMDDYSLWTDSLLYDRAKDTVYAYNKVVFYGNFLLSGDYLKYSLKTREGYLSRGEISFLSDDVTKRRFLWGSDVIIKNKDTFYIAKGGMSSCDGTKKAWHIEAEDINIELGEYLTSKDTALYASGIPIFYTPYFLAPVKKERESGFLMPSLGFSGKHGFFMDIPYYTVIDDSKDITNTLILKTRTSAGLGNQFRYMLSQREAGEINLTVIDNFDIKRQFVQATFKHTKESEDENVKFDLNYANRKDYFSLYALNSHEKTMPYSRSTGFYELFSRRNLYKGEVFFSQERQFPTGDFRYLKLSKEGYIYQKKNIGYNVNASVSSFFTEGDEGVVRLALEPYLSYRAIGNNSGVNGRLNLRLLNYINRPDDRGSLLTGLLQADIGGFYDKNLLVNDTYKVVNTFIVRLMLPYKLNDEITTTFDRDDILDETKKISYGYEQKWYTLSGLKQSLYLSFWQEYFISAEEARHDFSNLFFLLRILRDTVNLDMRGRYNTDRMAMDEISFTGTVKADKTYATMSYYRKEGEEEFLNLDLSQNLGYNTKVMAGTRYDIKRDIVRELSAGVEFVKSCYSLKAVVTKKGLP